MNRPQESLLRKTMTQFIVCTAAILLLAMPLFYWLTKNFYAEDLDELIEAVQEEKPIPPIDLESDVLEGILIQYLFLSLVLGLALIWINAFISKRLWMPFDRTLQQMEGFRLEKGRIPQLADSDIKEFTRLNRMLNRLIDNSLKSYLSQKEFTENASHELQTPLAVIQSKLDILLQQPGLNRSQATLIQELYEETNRLSRLSRNLLLLSKLDNNQYNTLEEVDVVTTWKKLRPMLESLLGDGRLHESFACDSLVRRGNQALLESLLSNLTVNAVRHNLPHGEIDVSLHEGKLTIANPSAEGELDRERLFNRFYHPSEKRKGNGLGLAIAKSICDYHGWTLQYDYAQGMHRFTIDFKDV